MVCSDCQSRPCLRPDNTDDIPTTRRRSLPVNHHSIRFSSELEYLTAVQGLTCTNIVQKLNGITLNACETLLDLMVAFTQELGAIKDNSKKNPLILKILNATTNATRSVVDIATFNGLSYIKTLPADLQKHAQVLFMQQWTTLCQIYEKIDKETNRLVSGLYDLFGVNWRQVSAACDSVRLLVRRATRFISYYNER